MSLALLVFCCVVVAEGCCFEPTVTVTTLFLLLHFHSHRSRIIRDRCMNILSTWYCVNIINNMNNQALLMNIIIMMQNDVVGGG